MCYVSRPKNGRKQQLADKVAAKGGASPLTDTNDRSLARVVGTAGAAGRRGRVNKLDPAEEAGPAAYCASERPLAASSARSPWGRVGDMVGMAGRYRLARNAATLAGAAVADHLGVVLGRSLWGTGLDAPAGPDDGSRCVGLAERDAAQPVGGGCCNSVEGEPVQLHGWERRAGACDGLDRVWSVCGGGIDGGGRRRTGPLGTDGCNRSLSGN